MEKERKGCGCSGHDQHDHDHEHDCGCGHDHEEYEVEVLRLTLDDDTEMECYVLGVFEVGEKEYIALVPTEDEEEVFLYEYIEAEDGIELVNIEDDDEYEKVVQAFEEAGL